MTFMMRLYLDFVPFHFACLWGSRALGHGADLLLTLSNTGDDNGHWNAICTMAKEMVLQSMHWL